MYCMNPLERACSKMRKTRTVLAVMLLLIFIPGTVWAAGITDDIEAYTGTKNITVQHALGAKASALAMEKLHFNKGDENVLAMTNAGCAVIGGQTTEKCVDGLAAVSGCTIGNSNLLLVQRAKNMPLWFAFFNKATNEMLYLEANNTVLNKYPTDLETLASEKIFTVIAEENIELNGLLTNNEAWNAKISSKVFGGNEFSLIGIAQIWSNPNCTYDFLRAAQFHNHICPGVNSGYLIIKYLDKHLPLQAGQSYKIIACPSWCKDDAFQVILDATVGKKGMYVKALTGDQLAMLPGSAKNVAGLFIRWNEQTATGDGLVLGFDFDKANELAGTSNMTGPFVKIKTALSMMDYVDRPEIMVSTIKQFKISSASELEALQAAGVDPLVRLGVVENGE
ncbi:FmdE, Molybdenum formylmethanofuran dehydrogenase operon [Desulfotomaculum arcticum]|uniref:FmdE, Molybdenum formylmethanofuran dehydrogenase operon n=2 Tax=Desulfotruncus TaxID=2867377 RepID=A0A1I2SZD5_9FIRM|nr:FmdE, Molybdenum formylmethanofuran dehydrogenase operon [Desulfotomaculum arcticum] [Desulfotruncus arcticus DSM 17038]